MFTTRNIVTATRLVKNFAQYSRHVRQSGEALLISQKGNQYVVLVNVEMFEDFVEQQLKAHSARLQEAQANKQVR